MQVEIEKQTLKINIKPNILVLLLKGKKDYEILGCKCSEWVVDAVKDFTYSIVEYDDTDLFNFAKRHSNNVDYIVLLLANMPLLTKNTFSGLIEYCLYKNVNACKFWGGAVFRNEYLKSAKTVFYDSVYTQNEDQFYLVENTTQRNYALDVLRNRILQMHLNNGVDIKNIKNVVIEKNVDVESGVCIESGNIIKGITKLYKGVILKENNVLTDCIIGENTCLVNSVIDNTTIGKDCIIMPYSNITNSQIGNNVVVTGNISMNGRKIRDNRKI